MVIPELNISEQCNTMLTVGEVMAWQRSIQQGKVGLGDVHMWEGGRRAGGWGARQLDVEHCNS